jgi:hypothetical protein
MTIVSRFARYVLPAAIALALVGLSGCSKEVKELPKVKVGETETYRDPAYGFSLAFPKGWPAATQVGRAAFYSAADVDQKFIEPTGQHPDGALFQVDVVKTVATEMELAHTTMDEMKKSGFQLLPEQPFTIGGKNGTRFTYSGLWAKNVKEAGEHIYVTVDSVVYDFKIAGFGGLYEAHSDVFAAMIASFQFPKPVEKGRDETLPSDAMSEYNGKLFSVQYPDNYDVEQAPKGNNDEVYALRGRRRDCSIRIDVFGAKNLTVEKVVEQNKSKYPGASEGKATVAGTPSVTLTSTPAKDISRRVYFTVKNDKVFRITMDSYKPQGDVYGPAYDKVIASFKIK